MLFGHNQTKFGNFTHTASEKEKRNPDWDSNKFDLIFGPIFIYSLRNIFLMNYYFDYLSTGISDFMFFFHLIRQKVKKEPTKDTFETYNRVWQIRTHLIAEILRSNKVAQSNTNTDQNKNEKNKVQ